jgi:hypothetical protein
MARNRTTIGAMMAKVPQEVSQHLDRSPHETKRRGRGIRWWRSPDVTEPGDPLPIPGRQFTTRQDRKSLGPKVGR